MVGLGWKSGLWGVLAGTGDSLVGSDVSGWEWPGGRVGRVGWWGCPGQMTASWTDVTMAALWSSSEREREGERREREGGGRREERRRERGGDEKGRSK